MTYNLVICRFSEQRYMILNLCTFLGHPVVSHDLQAESTTLRFHFKQVNTGTVLKELRNLKRSKSSGLDDIPLSLLKDATSCLAEPLTYLINMSLRTGQIPNEWKQAKVLPLFKSGNATELDNYRPISIFPVLSKVLERVVHTQFIYYLESKQDTLQISICLSKAALNKFSSNVFLRQCS